MNIKRYIKRLLKAFLNKPFATYSLEKDYLLSDSHQPLKNKVALVTGASGTIGGAIAWILAANGAIVYLGGRNTSKLKFLSEEMATKGLVGIPCVLDVTETNSIENALEEISSNGKTVNILVNCAGGSPRSRAKQLVDQDVKIIDEMLDTNLRGSLICSRVFGNKMRETGSGRIINISSIIGEKGKANFSDYAAAKAGIIGYTKSLAQELGKFGITVNCVSPGFIQRDLFTDEQLPFLLKSNFMNKVGTAEDIAEAVAFLAGDRAGFITGQNLCVDGGRSLGLHGE